MNEELVNYCNKCNETGVIEHHSHFNGNNWEPAHEEICDCEVGQEVEEEQAAKWELF